MRNMCEKFINVALRHILFSQMNSKCRAHGMRHHSEKTCSYLIFFGVVSNDPPRNLTLLIRSIHHIIRINKECQLDMVFLVYSFTVKSVATKGRDNPPTGLGQGGLSLFQ